MKLESFVSEVMKQLHAGAKPSVPVGVVMHVSLDAEGCVGPCLHKRVARVEITLAPPNDPSSATRPTRALDCNRDARAEFAAAHG